MLALGRHRHRRQHPARALADPRRRTVGLPRRGHRGLPVVLVPGDAEPARERQHDGDHDHRDCVLPQPRAARRRAALHVEPRAQRVDAGCPGPLVEAVELLEPSQHLALAPIRSPHGTPSARRRVGWSAAHPDGAARPYAAAVAARHRLPWSRGGRLGRLGRTRRERRRRRDGCDVLDGVECCCDAGNLFTLTWFGTLATVVLRAERYVPTGAPAQPSGRVARVLWRRVRAYQAAAQRPAPGLLPDDPEPAPRTRCRRCDRTARCVAGGAPCSGCGAADARGDGAPAARPRRPGRRVRGHGGGTRVAGEPTPRCWPSGCRRWPRTSRTPPR
nr:hypothetical protein [Angustibacter aerolatus]